MEQEAEQKALEEVFEEGEEQGKRFLHKLSNKIVEIAMRKRMGIILEDLNGIKERLNGSKSFNRRLSKWNARELQRMIEYKAKWHGIPVIYVNPKIPQEGRLMKCPKCGLIEDRNFIATVNLRMWGVRGSPERVGGSEAFADDGLMKTNPYGIILLEKQRLGLKVIECS